MSFKRVFVVSIALACLAVFLDLGFKAVLASIITKKSLGLFFSTIDIFSLSLLILMGFRSSMIVGYAKTKHDIKIINIFRIFLVSLVLVSWAVIIPLLKHKMGINIHYWYLVAMLLSMALWAYLTNQISMYRLYSLMNISQILLPVLIILWFFVAWEFHSVSGFHALFIAWVMGYSSLNIFLAISKLKLRIKEPPVKLFRLDLEEKIFLKNSFFSIAEFGSSMVIIYVGVLLFFNYYSIDELANFQVVVKPFLIGAIAIFIQPIFKFFLPEFSHFASKKDLTQIKKLRLFGFGFASLIGVFVASFFAIFGSDLVLFVFGQDYRSSVSMLTQMMFFFIFLALNAIEISILKAYGHFLASLLTRLLGLIVFVCSFFILRYIDTVANEVILSLGFAYMGMFVVSFMLVRWLFARIGRV